MTKQIKMTKQMTKKTETMPAYMKQNSGRGNENVTNEDLQLPRIDVLQGLSPQISKKNEEYIDGAEPGMLFNTLTGELYPDGVHFTPVSFVKRYLVWVNRKMDKNGGLRGVFEEAAEAEDFVSRQEDAEKLEISPTAEHLVILDSGDEVILSMAKSKLKVSRKFNSLVRLNGGDRFCRRYLLTTVGDESAQGEFENFKIDNVGFASEEVYIKAEKLYEAMAAGAKQATGNYDNATANTTASGEY